LALVTGVVGLLWGIGVFWSLDGQFQKYLAAELYRLRGKSYDRLVLLNAILILSLAAGGVYLSIPTLGLGIGLAIAAVATVMLLMALPSCLSSFLESDE
jgi:hypothetical protein